MAIREVSDEQLDVLVEQRLSERKKVVEEVVAALQPQLEGIRKEAASANHVKRTLGRQLTKLERLITATNVQLVAHAAQAAHAGTAEVIQRMEEALDKGEELTVQFGVEDLSLEQKQALPGMLKSYVNDQVDRQKLDRRNDRRLTVWLVGATAGGSLAGAVLAAIAVVAYLSQVHLTGAR